jgi:SSS family solute:Na+ symporter
VQIYVGAVALLANLVVAVIVTLIARQAKWFNGLDATNTGDYDADEGDPKLKEIAIG